MCDQNDCREYAKLSNGALAEEAYDAYDGIVGNYLEGVGRASATQADSNALLDG